MSTNCANAALNEGEMNHPKKMNHYYVCSILLGNENYHKCLRTSKTVTWDVTSYSLVCLFGIALPPYFALKTEIADYSELF